MENNEICRRRNSWKLLVATSLLAGAALQGVSIRAAAADELDLGSYRGQVVWVDFWASWCTPCRRSFPWMNDMMARYSDQGFVIVGVNVDRERDLAEEFLAETPAGFPIVYDPEGSTG